MYEANIRPGIIPIRNNARRNFRQGVGPRVTTQTKHRRYDRHRNPNAQFPEHRIPFKLLSSTTYPSLKTLAIYNTLTPGVDLPPERRSRPVIARRFADRFQRDRSRSPYCRRKLQARLAPAGTKEMTAVPPCPG